MSDAVRDFAAELRQWWTFDNQQQHTHSWHSREDFIQKRLPALLAGIVAFERLSCIRAIRKLADDLENPV